MDEQVLLKYQINSVQLRRQEEMFCTKHVTRCDLSGHSCPRLVTPISKLHVGAFHHPREFLEAYLAPEIGMEAREGGGKAWKWMQHFTDMAAPMKRGERKVPRMYSVVYTT